MLGRIARLYYDYDLTRQEIADILGVPHAVVTEALAEARRVGIVEIAVNTDDAMFHEEEAALINQYGIEHAWVAPTDLDDPAAPVARLAADSLIELASDGMRVAIGISNMMAEAASVVDPPTPVDVDFVPLQGTNPGLSNPRMPANIAHELARKFGGSSHDMAVPLFTRTADTAAMLRAEPGVAAVFELAGKCDAAFVGIGGSTPGSSIMMSGVLSSEQAQTLVSRGAVGDIVGRFFDSAGEPVTSPIDDRSLAIDLKTLRNIPIRIGVAGGSAKAAALHAALAGGLLNGVVTDVETARRLV